MTSSPPHTKIKNRLWKLISNEKKEAIRGFLTSFHFEVLKRAHKRFNFRNGSIGNFFLTGARLFFGSLEAGKSNQSSSIIYIKSVTKYE